MHLSRCWWLIIRELLSAVQQMYWYSIELIHDGFALSHPSSPSFVPVPLTFQMSDFIRDNIHENNHRPCKALTKYAWWQQTTQTGLEHYPILCVLCCSSSTRRDLKTSHWWECVLHYSHKYHAFSPPIVSTLYTPQMSSRSSKAEYSLWWWCNNVILKQRPICTPTRLYLMTCNERLWRFVKKWVREEGSKSRALLACSMLVGFFTACKEK